MTYYIGQEEARVVAQVISDNILERYVKPSKSYVSNFENKFLNFIDAQYCLAVNSGTSALICSLNALGITYGDEVIIPAYTYVATALSVIAVGAVPVIANINDSLTIDVKDLERKITKFTKAIIPVHMYGIPCSMDFLMDVAKKYNLYVIEDVAQACGGEFKGQKLGTIGDIAAFSFNHHKIISCGEGGAVVTNNKKLYLKSMIIHHGGIAFEENVHLNFNNCYKPGVNYRLAEILGAVLTVQIDRLEEFLLNLRNKKKILVQTIEKIKNKNFYLSPVPDQEGDCARTLFLKFLNPNLANTFHKILTKNNIQGFLAFSKGHTASAWQKVFESTSIMRQQGSNIYLKEKLDFKPELWEKSDIILQSTIGIQIDYNGKEEEIKRISNTLYTLLKDY